MNFNSIINEATKIILRDHLMKGRGLDVMPSEENCDEAFLYIREEVYEHYEDKFGELDEATGNAALKIREDLYRTSELRANRKWSAVLDLLDLV